MTKKTPQTPPFNYYPKIKESYYTSLRCFIARASLSSLNSRSKTEVWLKMYFLNQSLQFNVC